MQAHATNTETSDFSVVNYAKLLKAQGLSLYAYMILDADDLTPPHCLYSTFPQILHDYLVKGYGEKKCPYVAHAMVFGEAYGQKSNAIDEFANLLTEHQVNAIRAFESERIGVVSKQHGDDVHISIVGFDGDELSFWGKERFASTHELFSVQLFRNFPSLAKQPNRVRLSDWDLTPIEARFVRALLEEKSNLEIAKALGLSELTIAHIEAAVCNKMSVENSDHIRHLIREMQLAEAC